MSLLPALAYWKPNCFTNFPSRVNLRMWPSDAPFPPIQTMPLLSTVMPWFDSGHS